MVCEGRVSRQNRITLPAIDGRLCAHAPAVDNVYMGADLVEGEKKSSGDAYEMKYRAFVGMEWGAKSPLAVPESVDAVDLLDE